jgi:hypothetical protein
MQATEARLRRAHVGLAHPALPPRAVYSNDDAAEACRSAEYAALEARCAAQAAAWNSEAHRWHAERIDTAAELFRIEAGGTPASGSRAMGAAPMEFSATDMFSADAGLTACSALADLAEGQIGVNSAVAEARERVRWLDRVTLRRAAISALCEERRAAFVAQWRRKVLLESRAQSAAVSGAGAAR